MKINFKKKKIYKKLMWNRNIHKKYTRKSVCNNNKEFIKVWFVAIFLYLGFEWILCLCLAKYWNVFLWLYEIK